MSILTRSRADARNGNTPTTLIGLGHGYVLGHCYGKTMASVTELVKRYYTTVDAGDADATSALFSADASYDRPGYPTLVGQQIADFYHGERVIESGSHSLQEILVEGDRASSRGVFNGHLKDGSETSVGFADFFLFDTEGLIAERTTYFYQPAV